MRLANFTEDEFELSNNYGRVVMDSSSGEISYNRGLTFKSTTSNINLQAVSQIKSSINNNSYTTLGPKLLEVTTGTVSIASDLIELGTISEQSVNITTNSSLLNFTGSSLSIKETKNTKDQITVKIGGDNSYIDLNNAGESLSINAKTLKLNDYDIATRLPKWVPALDTYDLNQGTIEDRLSNKTLDYIYPIVYNHIGVSAVNTSNIVTINYSTYNQACFFFGVDKVPISSSSANEMSYTVSISGGTLSNTKYSSLLLQKYIFIIINHYVAGASIYYTIDIFADNVAFHTIADSSPTVTLTAVSNASRDWNSKTGTILSIIAQ